MIYTVTFNPSLDYIAVSYTHLDVYKRQHMYSLSREGMHMNEAYATAVILLVVVILINWVSDRIAKKLEKTS